MSETTNNGTDFVAFEYKDVTVRKTMQPIYMDCYKNFGWIFEEYNLAIGKPDFIKMRFKRNRKIRNKAEITRLQRQFDAYITEILRLEGSKTTKATVAAFMVGVIGTAFIAGSVFAVTAGNVGTCILFAIPGFIGWIIPYVLFRTISGKTTEQVNPLINQKYDELYSVCEKANTLLN